MSEHDFKLNVDSLIERLLEGMYYSHRNKILFDSRTLFQSLFASVKTLMEFF